MCQVSVQTLRFYDKIGLVKPSELDPSSGYRRYTNLNVLHIRIVQDLKSLNFSLDEIKRALKESSLEHLLQLMEEKRAETLQEIGRLEKVATSLERRRLQMLDLRQLGTGITSPDVLVELKHLPERVVACDRRPSGIGLEPMALRFSEFMSRMGEHRLEPAGFPFTVFHDPILDLNPEGADLEIGFPVLPGQPMPAFVRTIPEGPYITAVYCGIPDHGECREVYLRLREWMERNGYSEAGPPVEQYLVDKAQMLLPEEYIVELQIPVKKY